MKKTILVGIMFTMFMGAVSASSFNGEFEGSPIVKILNKGDVIDPIDVPAIIYKGRTMVPLSMLQSLGYDVAWNPKNYSVTVTDPVIDIEPTTTPIPQVNISQIAKNMKKNSVNFVGYTSDGDGFIRVTYYYDKNFNEINSNEFDSILTSSANTDAYLTEIYGDDGVIFNVVTQAIRDFKSGKITETELKAQYEYIGNNRSAVSSLPTTNTSALAQQNNTTVTAAQSTPQPTASPEPTATPKPDNTAQCQSIRDSYGSQIAMVGYEDIAQGPKLLKVHGLEYARDQSLSAAGC